jgi:hypothetical protein
MGFFKFPTLLYGKHDGHVMHRCAKVDPMLNKADHTMQSKAKQSSRGSSFGGF